MWDSLLTSPSASTCWRLVGGDVGDRFNDVSFPDAVWTCAHWTSRYSSLGSGTSLAVGFPVSTASGILQNAQGVGQLAIFSWQVRFEISPNLFWELWF